MISFGAATTRELTIDPIQKSNGKVVVKTKRVKVAGPIRWREKVVKSPPEEILVPVEDTLKVNALRREIREMKIVNSALRERLRKKVPIVVQKNIDVRLRLALFYMGVAQIITLFFLAM